MRLGRKPRIEPEVVYQVLHNKISEIFNANESLIPISNQIWTELSDNIQNKIPASSLYIMVYQNMHDWQTKLRNVLGFEPFIQQSIPIDDSSDTDVSFQTHDKNKILFKMTVPFDTFSKVDPITVAYKDKKRGYRYYDILKPGIWTDVINDLFLKEYKLPCNYIYKRGKVSRDDSKSQYYISFEAYCKDCGSEGWVDSKLENGDPLHINMLTEGTRGSETNNVTKRPLKGNKRRKIGHELSNDVGSNRRRKNVANLKFGRISPLNLYNLNVLSKTKQQVKDETLGITKKCPIQSLIELKYNSIHGSIHNLGIDPFFCILLV